MSGRWSLAKRRPTKRGSSYARATQTIRLINELLIHLRIEGATGCHRANCTPGRGRVLTSAHLPDRRPFFLFLAWPVASPLATAAAASIFSSEMISSAIGRDPDVHWNVHITSKEEARPNESLFILSLGCCCCCCC